MQYQHQPTHGLGRSLLLKTVRGSRLYGLHTDNSDYDYFEVYSGKSRMRQSIVGKQDVVRCSLDQFINGVASGTPEYLEALYSPYKTVDRLDHLSLHPSYWTTVNTYLRTIKSFWRDDPTAPRNFKLRRHSARLALNLQEFMEKGYFNPVLDAPGREWCEQYATAAWSYWRL